MPKQISDFMRYVNANLALEVQRLTGWRHGIWARRYQASWSAKDAGRRDSFAG